MNQNENQKNNSFYEKAVNILEDLSDKSTSVILLIFSCIFIIFSITHNDKYIHEAFLTLFYAVATNYLMLARKHYTIGKILVGTKPRLVFYILLFILLFVLWAMGIIFSKKIF